MKKICPTNDITRIQYKILHKRRRKFFYPTFTGMLFILCYTFEHTSSTSAAGSQHYIPTTLNRVTLGQSGVEAGISHGTVVVAMCKITVYK